MAESGSTLVCVSEDCKKDAVKFCKTCRQAFCSTHDKAHTELLKVLKAPHDVITVEEYQRKEMEEKVLYCPKHQNTPIIIACQHCYKPMCLKCIDDGRLVKTCSSTGEDQHETRSIEQVSLKIQDKMSDFLSELRIKQMTIADDMKERRKLFDVQMEEHRDDIEKLTVKVKELHKLLDYSHNEWKERLVEHMNMKKYMMDVLEAEFGEFEKNCQKIYDRTDEYRRRSDALIVMDQLDIKSKLEPLMKFECNENPELFNKLSLKLTGDAVKFPVVFEMVHPKQPLFNTPGTVRIPSNLKFREEVKAPSVVIKVPSVVIKVQPVSCYDIEY